MAGETPAGAAADGSLRSDLLHVFVLSSLGVAYPLLEVLSRAPEFLVVYGARRFEVVTLVLIVWLGVPLLLMGVELLARLGGEGLRKRLHAVLLFCLWAAVVAPVVNRILSGLGAGALLVSLLAGGLLTWMFAQRGELRSILSLFWPAAAVLPVYFLFFTPLSGLVLPPPAPESPSTPAAVRAPVVIIVFDEFPTGSLLDGDFQIDAERYPNMAALARDGIWFRNATSPADVTQAAIAAIVSGNYPAQNPLSVDSNRTRNLFTLLAPSHALHVRESYLHYCPEALCPLDETAPLSTTLPPILKDLAIVFLHVVLPQDMRSSLPNVSFPWLMLGPGGKASRTGLQVDPVVFAAQRDHHMADPSHRATIMREFADGVDAGDPATLHYLHVALPHEPSVYLPDGEICLPELMREPLIWSEDQGLADRAYARHLLQLEYVDRLVGEIVDKLKAKGLYDSALILLTADHGVSYRPGEPRRALSKENQCDIIAVPLILKPPGAKPGRISDRNVELVDVLPTLAELMQVELPWSVDGRSMLDGEERDHKTVVGPYWFGLEADFFGSKDRVQLPARLPEACFGEERTVALRGLPPPACAKPKAAAVSN